MLENRLPQNILYRKKRGFSIPLAVWLRGELKDFAEEALFSNKAESHSYFNPEYIKGLWKRHLSGRQDYAYPLWGLMMFELWQQRFLN